MCDRILHVYNSVVCDAVSDVIFNYYAWRFSKQFNNAKRFDVATITSAFLVAAAAPSSGASGLLALLNWEGLS